MQTKLHRWAAADHGRRFDDLFNLVCDPATLLVAFERVARNKGARTPGVDGLTVVNVERELGLPGDLEQVGKGSLAGSGISPGRLRGTSHAHEEGWTHYTGRLAVAAAGGDPGPDPWM
ncbi:hypothetical protein ACIBJF_48520 [Streptomyces sp. NPDC050743]|uniref:hypothetical protein n=1 Tax=Streptomyces sp. NPDC050743 TaxID=3365634 RepID=UPI00378F7111